MPAPDSLDPSRGSGKRHGSVPFRIWFTLLLASITLEGLGRRFLPGIPPQALYFAKDLVLVAGLLLVGLGRAELGTARSLMTGFKGVLMLAVIVTVLQLANPAQTSVVLGAIGLKSYWLWWLAPFIVARSLADPGDLEFAISLLAIFAIGISAFGAFQFGLSGDAAVNRYAWGSEDMGIASVHETGRVRVISTFSYITGLADFIVIAVPLLLAVGLQSKAGSRRWLCLSAAGAIAAVLPMTGSRGPVVIGLLTVGVIVWSAGLLRTREGRAMVVGAALIVGAGFLWSPEAVEGLGSRFDLGDTSDRFSGAAELLPHVAIASNEHPILGIGTGMQQNARFAFGIDPGWVSEGEMGRLLIELGTLGFLLLWLARVGLVVALVRAAALARRAGRGRVAGLALAFAVLTFAGALVFDHVYQAMYFVGLGFVLREVVALVPAVIPTPPVPAHPNG